MVKRQNGEMVNFQSLELFQSGIQTVFALQKLGFCSNFTFYVFTSTLRDQNFNCLSSNLDAQYKNKFCKVTEASNFTLILF